MKKVNIITIHFGTNHGSVLQAYALSSYLKSIGCDAKIIDYVPERYKMWNSLVLRKRAQYPMPILMAYYPIFVLKSLRVRNLFDRFVKHNLNLTNRYNDNEELKKNPPKADVYVCGSDQVWNNDYNGSEDFSYFLDFIPKNGKRVAYAASFGKENISNQKYIDKIKFLLGFFDNISVREKDALDILEKMEIPSIHVVDPVFLLSKEQWFSFATPIRVKERYTLVYVMDGLYQELLEYAQKIKEQTGNKIYVVSFNKIKDNRIDKCYYLTNPKDFVGLVHNADTVVTNSFHGTAFSILFQKKFLTIGKEKYNSRMLSLLNKMSLSDHFVPTGEEVNGEKVMMLIQRDDIDNEEIKLQEWIELSKKFIHNSLDF